MPLPTAAELTDPTATNTQMKQRLGQLAENVAARDDIAQNLLFDPFNETVKANLADDLQCVKNAECTSVLTNSANSIFGKPTLYGASNIAVRRYFDVKKLGLTTGSNVYVRLLAYSAAASGFQLAVFLRKADDSVIQTYATNPAKVGLYDHTFDALTITADSHHILVIVAGSSDKELLASSISLNVNPRFIYGALQPSLVDKLDTNLLFDPFNEAVSDYGEDLQSVQNAIFTQKLATSLNSTYGKPVLKSVSGTYIRRYLSIKKMGLKPGDVINIRLLTHFSSNSNAFIYCYIRNALGQQLAAYSTSKIVAGSNDTVLSNLILPENADHILISVEGNSDRELIATSVSRGRNPSFNYGAISPSYYASVNKSPANLMPDPIFRAYRSGVLTIDGYGPIEAVPNIVDQTLSPFRDKKAILLGAGFTNKHIKFDRLGLKVGSVLSVKVGLIIPAGGNFTVSMFTRGIDNTVYSTEQKTYSLIANTYTEISIDHVITQTDMDSAHYIQLRLNTTGTSFAGGYYVCAFGAFVNNSFVAITDTNYVEDTLLTSMATLEKSLSTSVAPFIYGEWFLRETRQRTRKRLLGESKQFVVASIGDSWTHRRERWSGPTAETLMSQFGDAGGGWTGFGTGGTGLENDNVRTTYTVSREGAWTSRYGSSVSPDICEISSNTAGNRIFCRAPASPQVSACQLFYVGSSDGVIKYRMTNGSWADIESVAWTTLNLNAVATGELGIAELTGIPTGQVSLQIEVVSGTVTLCGVNWKSDADGVVWHKIAGTGTNTGQWTSINATQWAKGLQALNPSLVTILHGTNDQNGRTAAAFASNIGALIDRIRSVLPLADILVVMPCENGRANSIAMSDYANAAYSVCKTKKVAFMDLQKVFGESFSEYSSTSPRNWFNADLIHPEPSTGGRAITDAVVRFLLA